MYYQLSVRFMDVAWNRLFELCDEAELKFGRQTKIYFWRRYFQCMHLGEEAFPEEAERMVDSEAPLVPYCREYTSGTVSRRKDFSSK